jgi:hypothetical protein
MIAAGRRLSAPAPTPRLSTDTDDKIADVTARERLHQLVDELSDQEATMRCDTSCSGVRIR